MDYSEIIADNGGVKMAFNVSRYLIDNLKYLNLHNTNIAKLMGSLLKIF